MQNLDKARQLKSEVENWVGKTFNFIQLEVFEKMTDNMLFEYIEPYDYMQHSDEFFSHMTEEEVKEVLESFTGEEIEEDQNLSDAEAIEAEHDGFWEYFEKIKGSEIEDFVRENSYDIDHYPMWNTLFELKNWSEFTEHQREVLKEFTGIGIISGVDCFNETLFIMSAGHSFYSSYWIPMYLGFFPEEGKKYKDVDFSMV